MSLYPVIMSGTKIFLFPKEEIGFQLFQKNLPKNKQYLNMTSDSWSVLKHCDGQKNIETLLDVLNTEFEINHEQMVVFLREMEDIQIIQLNENPVDHSFTICGNGELYFPKHVSFTVTEICNIDCSYCYMGGSNNTKGFSSFETIVEILENLKTNHVQTIELTGGEPMIHPRIFDIVKYCNENFHYTNILTNGVNFPHEIISYFFDNPGKIHIQVSIDGSSDKITDKVRQTKNTHSQTVKTIRNLLSHNIHLRVAIVLTEDNADDLENMIISMKELGVQNITVTFPEQYGSAEQNHYNPKTSFINMIEKYIDSLEPIFEKYKDIVNIEMSDFNKIATQNLRNCGAGFKTVAVNHEGNVYPCPVLNNSVQKLGNILTDDYYGIFNDSVTSKIFRKFDLKSTEDASCKECGFNNYCSSCLSKVYLANKSFRTEGKEICSVWESLEGDKMFSN